MIVLEVDVDDKEMSIRVRDVFVRRGMISGRIGSSRPGCSW